MLSRNDIEGLLFFGANILVNNTCMVKNLCVSDVFTPSYSKYLFYLTLLLLEKEDVLKQKTKLQMSDEEITQLRAIEERLSQVSILEYILSCAKDATFFVDLKEALATFICGEIHIFPESRKIFLGSLAEGKFLDEETFEDIRTILRLQNHFEEPEIIPENESAMAKKFRVNREKVRKAKMDNAVKSGETCGILSEITAYKLLMQCSQEELKKTPLVQFYKVLDMAKAKETYEIDINSLLAGADSKKVNPKYWIRDIKKN